MGSPSSRAGLSTKYIRLYAASMNAIQTGLGRLKPSCRTEITNIADNAVPTTRGRTIVLLGIYPIYEMQKKFTVSLFIDGSNIVTTQ